VEVTLDGYDDGIPCTVGSVKQAAVTLNFSGTVPTDVGELLANGSLALLSFRHDGKWVALRGAVCAHPDGQRLEFVALDGFARPERRDNERVPLAVPFQVIQTARDGSRLSPLLTVSQNISVTGALLERRDGMDETSTRWDLEFVLSSNSAAIACGAVVARWTPAHVGVAFSGLAANDRIRLTAIIAARLTIAKLAA
jgi:PilZ domain